MDVFIIVLDDLISTFLLVLLTPTKKKVKKSKKTKIFKIFSISKKKNQNSNKIQYNIYI
jgi:hypothetical protein